MDNYLFKIEEEKQTLKSTLNYSAIETYLEKHGRKGRNEMFSLFGEISHYVESRYNKLFPLPQGWMSTEQYEKEKKALITENQFEF